MSDRLGRDVPMIVPEGSNDLTAEEIEYLKETQNLCSNCVCSVGKQCHRNYCILYICIYIFYIYIYITVKKKGLL